MHQTVIKNWSYFRCPCCDMPVSLPPQGQLGKTEDLRYQPTGSWPIELLCVERTRWGQAVPGEFYEPFLVHSKQPLSDLWEIVCECAHENCEMKHTLYAHSLIDIDAGVLADIAAHAEGQAPACRGIHRLEMSQEKIAGVRRIPL